MNQFTLADLMAIDYWKDQGMNEAKIAGKLNMDYETYRSCNVPKILEWALNKVYTKDQLTIFKKL